MDFKEEIVKLLTKSTKLKKEEITSLLTIPPDAKLGDYAFPCFKLVTSKGSNPKDEAEKLKDKLTKTSKLSKSLSKVEVVGPYLNFFVDKSAFAEKVLEKVFKRRRSYGKSKENKIVLVEFCGPNTNKPLHLGHIRNMALGLSITKIFGFLGNKIHPVNIVNDRGIHICQSMIAYKKWGKNKHPDKKGDHFVGDYYVLFSKKSKENESLKLEAQEMLLKWEREDKETRELWKKMNSWVLRGFNETYKRFGIKFDKEYFESAFFEKGKEVAKEGLRKGIFEKDHTEAVVAPLEKYNLPNKVLLRGDETSVYMTFDLYLAHARYLDYKFDKLIYVVASEQNLHFKQLFKILELLKRPYAKSLFHLSYGLVNLPSGRMKSREGTVVDADDLMDETSKLAEKEIKKRYKNLPGKEIRTRAEFVSQAAIKFFMLKVDPVRDMVYNPAESLSFDGETGPYVQYTHARSCSILRKAKKEEKVESTVSVNFTKLIEPEESVIIKLLDDFPDVVTKAAKSCKPHHIAQYLLSLAQAFNEFYHKHHVISEDKELMKARLLLVDSVRQVLENGLSLLGIKAPQEM